MVFFLFDYAVARTDVNFGVSVFFYSDVIAGEGEGAVGGVGVVIRGNFSGLNRGLLVSLPWVYAIFARVEVEAWF